MEEVFADPQVQHREMVQEVAHPLLGTLRLPGLPIKLSESPGAILRHPPLLGEHTTEVLEGLGYSQSDIADMLARAVARSTGGP
jgi:crotonobetainyl-CoA:carnitine CoA-transferase CaiB-like acyl-CoA transferase